MQLGDNLGDRMHRTEAILHQFSQSVDVWLDQLVYLRVDLILIRTLFRVDLGLSTWSTGLLAHRPGQSTGK